MKGIMPKEDALCILEEVREFDDSIFAYDAGYRNAMDVAIEALKELIAQKRGRKVKENMELKDTVELMNSEDYRERFKAEYYQAKIRYDKLDAITVKYEAGTLNFEPKCSLELLKEQKMHLGNYIRTLKIRAEIEGIDLNY